MRRFYKAIVLVKRRLRERRLQSLLQKITSKIQKLQQSPAFKSVSEV